MLLDSEAFLERASRLGCPKDYFLHSGHRIVDTVKNYTDIVNAGKDFYFRLDEGPGILNVIMSDDNYVSNHESMYYSKLLPMIKHLSH